MELKLESFSSLNGVNKLWQRAFCRASEAPTPASRDSFCFQAVETPRFPFLLTCDLGL